MKQSSLDRLPPLTALRAFEAAARHLSFANAAAELHVTPAALSQQIKSLEAHLGAPVFRRLNRKVELTDVGQGLVPGVADGFKTLKTAWAGARRRLEKQHLTVTAGPVFMASWLAPRMGRFVNAHPDIELRFTSSLRMLSFERDEIDLAIRFGAGDDAGYFSEDLFLDWATPMVAPALADQIKTPKDLQKLPVIHQNSGDVLADYENWSKWSDAVGLTLKDQNGPVFTTPDAALNYAENGGGVVLGRISLAERLLEAGRLVMPLTETIRTNLRYRLVCPLGTEAQPNLVIFRQWLHQEIAELQVWDKDRRFLPQ